MGDVTAEFFEELGSRGHVTSLEKTTGTIRVKLGDDKGWLVSVDKGDISVSRRAAAADCTLTTTKAFFDDIVRGNANAMASVMRGTVGIEGDWQLLVLFQRLLPGPANGGKRSEQ
jgi:putative sterol carrier protein